MVMTVEQIDFRAVLKEFFAHLMNHIKTELQFLLAASRSFILVSKVNGNKI